jgi:hypothetical protein
LSFHIIFEKYNGDFLEKGSSISLTWVLVDYFLIKQRISCPPSIQGEQHTNFYISGISHFIKIVILQSERTRLQYEDRTHFAMAVASANSGSDGCGITSVLSSIGKR